LSIINPIYSNIFQLKIANSGYHFFEMVEYPICKFDSFPCIGNGGFYDFLDGKNPKSSCNLRWILVFDIFNSFLDVLVNTFFFQFNRCFTFWILSFVSTLRWRPVDLISLILPVLSTILIHLLILDNDNTLLESLKIFVAPSPFLCLHFTIFWRSRLFISYKVISRVMRNLMIQYCRELNVEYFSWRGGN
jgi:hypothetical protein